jgi:hypothetical protein
VLGAGCFGLTQLSSSSASSPAFGGAGAAGPASVPHAASSGSSSSSSSDTIGAPGISRQNAPDAGSFPTGHADVSEPISVNGPLEVAASDTDLQTAGLGRQLETLLAAYAQLHSTQASASVKACVRSIADNRPVKLVASARYGGSPATVVIVETNAGYQGIVAGPGCSATNSDVVAMALVP